MGLEARIWGSRLKAGGGTEEEEKEEEREEKFLLCESIGHRPLSGPLPKNERFEAYCVCFYVGEGFGCGWRLAAPANPSATIL